MNGNSHQALFVVLIIWMRDFVNTEKMNRKFGADRSLERFRNVSLALALGLAAEDP